MIEEPKSCPSCGKTPQGNNWHTYGKNPKDEMRYFCATDGCPNALHKAMTAEEWNTRPLEDALRAELAAAKAEAERLREQRDKAKSTVSRLREIIRKVEWVNPPARVGTYCLYCALPKDYGHHETCPFYGWEGER